MHTGSESDSAALFFKICDICEVAHYICQWKNSLTQYLISRLHQNHIVDFCMYEASAFLSLFKPEKNLNLKAYRAHC